MEVVMLSGLRRESQLVSIRMSQPILGVVLLGLYFSPPGGGIVVVVFAFRDDDYDGILTPDDDDASGDDATIHQRRPRIPLRTTLRQ